MLRSAKIYVIFTVIFSVFMQSAIARSIVLDPEVPELLTGMLLGYSLLYLSLICIPFLGNALLSRILFEERMENAVHVILATGVDPRVIWLGKVLMVYAICYFAFLLSVLSYYLISLLYFRYKLTLTGEIGSLAFIIMPLLSLGVMSILAYLYWALKSPQIFGLVFPLAFVLGAWNLGMNWAQEIPPAVVALGAFALSLVLLLASIYAVKHLSKERITNL